jgi:hypothetical protein
VKSHNTSTTCFPFVDYAGILAASGLSMLIVLSPSASQARSENPDYAYTCGNPSPSAGSGGGTETISASDAILALQAAVGTNACPPCVCDVAISPASPNGTVSASDAELILRRGVGSVGPLQCTDNSLQCIPCTGAGLRNGLADINTSATRPHPLFSTYANTTDIVFDCADSSTITLPSDWNTASPGTADGYPVTKNGAMVNGLVPGESRNLTVVPATACGCNTVNGTGASLLKLDANDVLVKGFTFQNFLHGILFSGADDTVSTCAFTGTCRWAIKNDSGSGGGLGSEVRTTSIYGQCQADAGNANTIIDNTIDNKGPNTDLYTCVGGTNAGGTCEPTCSGGNRAGLSCVDNLDCAAGGGTCAAHDAYCSGGGYCEYCRYPYPNTIYNRECYSISYHDTNFYDTQRALVATGAGATSASILAEDVEMLGTSRCLGTRLESTGTKLMFADSLIYQCDNGAYHYASDSQLDVFASSITYGAYRGIWARGTIRATVNCSDIHHNGTGTTCMFDGSSSPGNCGGVVYDGAGKRLSLGTAGTGDLFYGKNYLCDNELGTSGHQKRELSNLVGLSHAVNADNNYWCCPGTPGAPGCDTASPYLKPTYTTGTTTTGRAYAAGTGAISVNGARSTAWSGGVADCHD